MKQKYRVHYKKSLIEYDDNDFIDVEVPEVNTCPNCNIATLQQVQLLLMDFI